MRQRPPGTSASASICWGSGSKGIPIFDACSCRKTSSIIRSGRNSRCSAFYWAIRERYEAEGRPKDLTWISVGGQGGRGRAPGTVEEVGREGLVTRFISGHVETAKALLKLADSGRLDLHVMPQGELVWLIEGQGHVLAAPR